MSNTEEQRLIRKEINKKYYYENKEKVLKKQKERYYKNRERLISEQRDRNKNSIKDILKINKYAKNYYEQNKEAIKKKQKQRYQKNKEKILNRIKEYRKNNKNQILRKAKEYRDKNKKINLQKEKIRYDNDIVFKIKKLIRRQFRSALRLYTKNGKTKILKEYGINIQSIFEKLGNPPQDGKFYHIDHIFPVSAFDLNNPEHIKLCWHPNNLQWLEASENCS